MKYCSIENCEQELSPRSNLGVCPTCRGSINAWRKRRPAEVLQRRQNLHRYDARMSEISEYRRVK